MGFTTTFLTPGHAARKLSRGEKVCIVCKTRRASKMVAKDHDIPSYFKPKTFDNVPNKSKKKAHQKQVAQVDDSDDDDVVEIISSTQNPQQTQAKNQSR